MRTTLMTPRSRIGARRSDKLPPHDREPLVGDGPREADRLPELRGRGTRRVGACPDLRVGLDRGEAAPGEVVAHRRDERPCASPSPRASAVVAMQVMTAGSGESGSDGYRSRVRCARG